jgi:hypothetical protein
MTSDRSQRAAALSPDPTAKAFRLVGAARAEWEAGDGDRARTSLAGHLTAPAR